MKRITLIRHAKSSWKDPVCADCDRPLTKRGKNDALAMGVWIMERGSRPTLIVSSPAKRALSTMKRIVAEMGLSEKKIVRDGRLYEAGAHDLLAFVRGLEDNHEEVMVCGHNPALTDFCNYLAGCYFDNLPTCAVVIIDVMVDTWTNVKENSGRILTWNCPVKTHNADVVQTTL
jgi:phosphohistidine phosphatase